MSALVVAGFVALGVVVAANCERWSGWWFECEDPRPLALFRIAFAVLVVWDVDGLAPHFELLFGGEGMFTGAGQSWGCGPIRPSRTPICVPAHA